MVNRTLTLIVQSFTALKIMPTTHAGKDVSGGAKRAFELLKHLKKHVLS